MRTTILAELIEALVYFDEVDADAFNAIAFLGFEEIEHLGSTESRQAEIAQRHLGNLGVAQRLGEFPASISVNVHSALRHSRDTHSPEHYRECSPPDPA